MTSLGVVASSYVPLLHMGDWLVMSYADDHATAPLSSMLNRVSGSTMPCTNGTTGLSVVGASTPNGGKSFRFPSADRAVGGYVALPEPPSTDSEVWAVIKSDGADCGLWTLGANDGPNTQSHYPFWGGVYEGYAISEGIRQSFTPSLSITDWRVYRVRAAGGANGWQASIDGVIQAQFEPILLMYPATAYLGVGSNNFGLASSFQGNIAAFLLRNRVSTDVEVARIYAHLKAVTGVGP